MLRKAVGITVKSHICFLFFLTCSPSTAKIVTGTVKNGALKWNNEDVASASFATHESRDRPEEQSGFYVRRAVAAIDFPSLSFWRFFLKVVVMVEKLKTGAAGANTKEQNWTAADALEWLKYHLWLFLKNYCCIIFLGEKWLFNSFFLPTAHISFGGLESFGNITFIPIGHIPVVVNNSSNFYLQKLLFPF